MGLCWPQPLRRCAAGLERAGETADEGGLGAPCRIGEADAACGFLDPHSDLEQAQPDRGKLGSGQIANTATSSAARVAPGRSTHRAASQNATPSLPAIGARGCGSMWQLLRVKARPVFPSLVPGLDTRSLPTITAVLVGNS